MNIFGAIYYYLFYLPLSYLFQFLLGIFKNYLLAIIFLAIIIKIVIFPLTRKNIQTQKKMQKVQEEIKKIEEKYKTNPQKKAEEILLLYKKEKISFLGSFLIFFQLPVFFALYQIFLKETKNGNPHFFLGNINLAQPNYLLAFFAFFFQFFYLNLISKTQQRNLEEKIWRNLPLFATIFIFLKLPAIILVYWIFFSIFSIIEHRLFYVGEK